MPKQRKSYNKFYFMLDWRKLQEQKGHVYANLREVQNDPECNVAWQHRELACRCTSSCNIKTDRTFNHFTPEDLDKPTNPNLEKIANDITSLNLNEIMELSNLLKKRLNLLVDAPVMAVGDFIAAPKSDESKKTRTQVKSSFTIKLIKFDEKQMVALIKEIKNLLPNTNLEEVTNLIESVPTVVMADISQDEADKIKESIVKLGGEVEIT